MRRLRRPAPLLAALVIVLAAFAPSGARASADDASAAATSTSVEASSASSSSASSATKKEWITVDGLLTGAFAPPSPSDPNQVINMDAQTLFSALVNHTVVVVFAVDWCALCTGYEPEFRRAADAFRGLIDPATSAPLVFGVIDVDANKPLAKTFGVTNAPFVTVLKRGEWYAVDEDTGETNVLAPNRYEGAAAARLCRHVRASTRPTRSPNSPRILIRYTLTCLSIRSRTDQSPIDTSAAGYLGAVNTVEHVNGEVPGLDAALAPYVQELTDDTIDAYVNDADYDVLVEFYAPWCGHCKQFEPFYREVGVHFAGSDVRVAKIDVDAYRAAATRYDVRGLPSVQLFPKGYKTRGLQFTGAERKPASIIAFVKSPQVYLVESSVGDMKEWECVVWLESKGVLRRGVVTELVGLMGPDDAGQGGGAGPFVADAGNSTAHDAAAREMFKEAHGWSSRGRWLETMEILVCLAHTTPLRRTGIGSSPGMWNFLDNARMHVEDPSLGGGEGGGGGGEDAEYGTSTDAETAALNAAAEGRRMNPDGEDWDAFGGADGAMEEREATGFDWEAWEAFASRDVGDAYAGGGRDEL